MTSSRVPYLTLRYHGAHAIMGIEISWSTCYYEYIVDGVHAIVGIEIVHGAHAIMDI